MKLYLKINTDTLINYQAEILNIIIEIKKELINRKANFSVNIIL
jgi:hypothetical protein